MTAIRISRFAQTGFEVLVSLILVVLFFGIFLLLLNVLFPIGGGLKQKAVDGNELGALGRMERTVTDLLMMRDGEEIHASGNPTATLTTTTNTVKAKRSGQIAWRGINQGAKLYDGDGIQTARKSNALVTFNDKNYLRMGENSLVIIRRMEQDAILPQNQSVVVMAEGEVWGRVEQTGSERAYLEVTTPAADARIRSHAGSGAAEFKISINEDKSSTVSVFKGQVEVSAKGESVIISENQQAAVNIGAAPSAPQKLLDQVALDGPDTGKQLFFRDLPPRVRFAWLPVDGVSHYQFVLSRDPEFRQLIVDTDIKGYQFHHGNLVHGSYYWRVRGKQKQREGALSETRTLTLVQDTTAPTLRVSFPPAITRRSEYTITGATEPGAKVFVAGRPTVADSQGMFSAELKIKRGLNVIVVESIDAAGNVQYRSKTVHGKF